MIKENPLVSVIALCYNQKRFVMESLQSVVSQDFNDFEIIIVDDFSTDDSREEILKFIKKHPVAKVIFNEKNLGNCQSFNNALKIAQGKYIIDLSVDDVMLPNRISEQVKVFESSEAIGVVFSDCEYIDEHSNRLDKSGFNDSRKRKTHLPVGYVYSELLAIKLYINPPTMMVRKAVFEILEGYDETLSYEDFDFWVRAAKITKFGYTPAVLMQQRKLKGSHSTKFIQKKNVLIPSKWKVCQKALALNETEEENSALIIRLKSFLRQCFFTEHFEIAQEVIDTLRKLNGNNWETFLFQILISMKIPTNFLYIRFNSLRGFLQFRRFF